MQTESTGTIDVVIVNYNAGALLSACVNSMIDPRVAQIIVVDNKSHDQSIADLENNCTDPRLKIARNDQNLGFAAGCNIGVMAGTAKNILFLNPDCQMSDGALQRLEQVLESAPKNGMVGGYLTNTDGTEQRGGRRNMPTPMSSFTTFFNLPVLKNILPKSARPINLNDTSLPNGPTAVEAISGACMLVKRAALDDVGLWDEGYFLHCEDLDFCMRFAQKSWQILFVPDAHVSHVKGASSGNTQLVEYHKHRGMARFYKKFYADSHSAFTLRLVYLGIWGHYALLSAMVKLGIKK